jgi:hypothetical protein
MIRAVLSVMLCGACLGVGLFTSNLQAENYQAASELDRIKRKCDLLEASCERTQYEINVRLREVEHELLQQSSAEAATEDEFWSGAEGVE